MKLIDPEVLRMFREKTTCEFCGRPCPDGCDPHHFWRKRGMGGGSRIDHPLNLISLCRGYYRGKWVSCHDDAEAGRITKYDLLALVARREGVLQDEIITALEGIRRLSKWASPEEVEALIPKRAG